jgi:hypothetical protein
MVATCKSQHLGDEGSWVWDQCGLHERLHLKKKKTEEEREEEGGRKEEEKEGKEKRK